MMPSSHRSREHKLGDDDSEPVDIAVYVALGEEWKHVRAVVKEHGSLHALRLASSKVAGECYKTTIDVPGGAYTVAFVLGGRMGLTHASAKASAALFELNPANFVVLGIAGSVSSDLALGDMFVPASVNEYMANSSANDDGEDWGFQLSGTRESTNNTLLSRFQSLESLGEEWFEEWVSATRKRTQRLSGDVRRALPEGGASAGNLVVGDDRVLLSGPTVGKSTRFSSWLKEKDRKACAIDMETAGVYAAASTSTTPPRVVATRCAAHGRCSPGVL